MRGCHDDHFTRTCFRSAAHVVVYAMSVRTFRDILCWHGSCFSDDDLRFIILDNSTQTSSVLVDFDTSSISADQLNRFGKPWYLGEPVRRHLFLIYDRH